MSQKFHVLVGLLAVLAVGCQQEVGSLRVSNDCDSPVQVATLHEDGTELRSVQLSDGTSLEIWNAFERPLRDHATVVLTADGNVTNVTVGTRGRPWVVFAGTPCVAGTWDDVRGDT